MLIAKYQPYLNNSPVKHKKVIPSETLLRETLIKASDFLVVIGIELPRISNQIEFDRNWWIPKKVINLPIVHLGLDESKLGKIAENDPDISSGIVTKIFGTKKSYANVWEIPSKSFIMRTRTVPIRLLVNGYAVFIN